MLISEFARTVSLPTDTVRFYMRVGLLKPAFTLKGGRRPYAVFSDEHLDRVSRIRNLQIVGYTLREIASMIEDDTGQAHTPERSRRLLSDQLSVFEKRRMELDAMIISTRERITALDKINLATAKAEESKATFSWPAGPALKPRRNLSHDREIDLHFPFQVALPLAKTLGKDGHKPFDFLREKASHYSLTMHRVSDGTGKYDVFCFQRELDAQALLSAFDGVPFYPEDRRGGKWNRPPGDVRLTDEEKQLRRSQTKIPPSSAR